MKAIGREKEIRFLEALFESDKSEFVAVYGRRRVGKTYLVDSVFNTRYAFRHSAPSNDENKTPSGQFSDQLEAFHDSLILYGEKNEETPKTWREAFARLRALLDEKESSSEKADKLVVFFDELSWMDVPQSNFLPAFSFFINNYVVPKGNILFIACGSSLSYMQKKILFGKGSMYRRVSKELNVMPFTLKQTEEFLLSRGINYSRYDIACCYMAFGGIPYYLDYLQADISLAQNIDNLFFRPGAILANEFTALMKESFSNG